jgi:spore coat polysaccharide biosynthesis protein SpsF
MTSSRFPGKVLAGLNGRPMIARQLERLARSTQLEGLVVATSVDDSDDELADFVGSLGVEIFRGDLNDVLGRFVGVAERWNPEVIVRLTADCPLASPSVIDRVVSEFFANEVDYASNTLNPTFPDGIDVEVVKSSALTWVNENSTDADEREHVTLGVYRRPEDFRLLSVRDSVDHSSLRWTVDEAADLEFVRWVYCELYEANPGFEYQDILDLIARNPTKSRTSADAVRNAALAGLDTGAMDV